MSATVSESRVCSALLDFVQDGVYPDSEEIVSFELAASAISEELQLISAARQEVEVRSAGIS